MANIPGLSFVSPVEANGMDGVNAVTKGTKASDLFSELMQRVSNPMDLSAEASTTDVTIDVKVDSASSFESKIKVASNEKKDIAVVEKETAEFSKEVVKTISEALGVSEEDVESAMESLGLQAWMLLEPQNLANLMIEIQGDGDLANLLVQGDFLNLLNEIDSLGVSLLQELDLNLEQFTEIMNEMQPVSENDEIVAEMNLAETQEGVILSDSVVGEVLAEENVVEVQDVKEEKEPFEVIVERKSDGKNEEVNTVEEDERTVLPSDSKKAETQSETKDFTPNHESKDDSTNVSVMQNTNDSVTNNPEVVTDTTTHFQSYLDDHTVDIMNQIVEQTKFIISEEQTSMEMQLNPENLGKIYLQLTAKEGAVNAQLQASNEAVKAALEAQIATLRENLNQAGVKVDAVEVTVSSHAFEENLEQNQKREEQEGERQQEQISKRRNINFFSLDELAGVMSEEESLVAQMMLEQGNSVDMTA